MTATPKIIHRDNIIDVTSFIPTGNIYECNSVMSSNQDLNEPTNVTNNVHVQHPQAKPEESSMHTLSFKHLTSAINGHHPNSITAKMYELETQFQAFGEESKCQELKQMYRLQLINLETDRQMELRPNVQNNPWFTIAINYKFDQYVRHLINRVEKSLNLMKTIKESRQIKRSFASLLPTLSAIVTQDDDLQHQVMTSCFKTDKIPEHDQTTKRTFSKYLPTINEPIRELPYMQTSGENVVKQRTPPGSSKLNPLVVEIMRTWYNRNLDHPYPTSEACKSLAASGNITMAQVRKWFANRRLRDNNTKSQEEIHYHTHIRKRKLMENNEPANKRHCQEKETGPS
jgi:hypothetical protein